MKIIYVFGGSGFIGRYLSSFLRKSEFETLNISLRNDIPESTFNKDGVFINLIGKAHDFSGIASKEDYYHANLALTIRAFGLFLQSSSKIFVQISSIAAVEEYESLEPLKEDDVCQPESWYGKSKREAEKWLLEQQVPSDRKVIILRPPMVYGPGDKGNLSKLYKFVKIGLPYPLSAFNNKRSFISIDNLCYFILCLINDINRVDSGIYHVADDEFVSTNQIISIIQEVTGEKIFSIPFPRNIIKFIAKIGDVVPIPLNSVRLKKMTSDFLVSNEKIKSLLLIKKLPKTSEDSLKETFKSINSTF